MQGRFNDLTGRRFGRLLVIERAPAKDSTGQACWRCQCDCGTSHEVRGQVLVRGESVSCGCLKAQLIGTSRSTHGRSGTAEYVAWTAMIARCENPNNDAFARYGGRGIRICKRWRGSFALFLKDMGPKPARGYTLDRIDNDGPYSPSNCRWATRTQQSRNQSTTRMVTINGETRAFGDWCAHFGIKLGTANARTRGRGWSDEEALTTRTLLPTECRSRAKR